MDRRPDFSYSAARNSVAGPNCHHTRCQASIRAMVVAQWTRRFAQLILQGKDVQVLVRDNNVDQALRALKKKLQREGVFREMKLRDHYEKPSEKRAREKAEAVRRARKVARKRAQRDGLLPVKAKPVR
jgi:small subunit ribosomal protein S21